MNTAVSLENKQTSIFKELISQRNSDEISFLNALSQKRIIQYIQWQPLEYDKHTRVYDSTTNADCRGSNATIFHIVHNIAKQHVGNYRLAVHHMRRKTSEHILTAMSQIPRV
uniref:Eukaryotic translation initiation factor 3 subunit 6 n=1 Tax=Arundo donax TaxID=35708 RepID=A0A0A9F1Q8_ARUDO